MTDPERISKRGVGLAAQLLQAGADEQPRHDGVQRTLLALGVSGVVLTSTSAASAATGAKLMSGAAAIAGTANVVSTTLLLKWVGIGVVAGIGLAGAAAVATAPSAPARVASIPTRSAPQVRPQPAIPKSVQPAPALAVAPTPEASAATPTPMPTLRTSVVEAPSEPDLGAPLAAEVAFVDRGRALLRGGRDGEALALLEGYEHEFSEPRLLPEVLFLRLEAYQRLDRDNDARRVAQRLVNGFPKSPHAARARKLLAP